MRQSPQIQPKMLFGSYVENRLYVHMGCEGWKGREAVARLGASLHAALRRVLARAAQRELRGLTSVQRRVAAVVTVDIPAVRPETARRAGNDLNALKYTN